MAYTILRAEKLKNLSSIAASAQHTFRERETPNADPLRTPLNQHAGATSSAEVLEKLDERLLDAILFGTSKKSRRKDAVLAIEYMIGASPEWFADKSDPDIEEYFRRARAFLVEKHGAENVIYFGTQRDEQTPHAVAYVVPIDENGNLNCKAFLGGGKKLSAMQTAWAANVADLGLERGVQGSKVRHEDVQHYWGALERAKQGLPELEPPTKDEAIAMLAEQRFPDRVETTLADLAMTASIHAQNARKLKSERERLVASAKTYVEKKREEVRVATLEEVRVQNAILAADRDKALNDLRIKQAANTELIKALDNLKVELVVKDIEIASKTTHKTLRLNPIIERWATGALEMIVRAAKRFGVHLVAQEKFLDRIRDVRSVVDREDADRGPEISR